MSVATTIVLSVEPLSTTMVRPTSGRCISTSGNDSSFFIVPGHLIDAKSLIVAFYVVTRWMVYLLMRHVDIRVGWLILYAWCPLVLKKFANSGHLDSIALFLTVCTACGMARAIFPRSVKTRYPILRRRKRPHETVYCFAAVMTTLVIGVKLYSLIRGSVLFLSVGRRIGWRNRTSRKASLNVPDDCLVLGVLADS